MALKSHIDAEAYNALPDPVKAEYSEISDGDHAGQFGLQVEGVNGYALDNVEGLRTSLANERKTTGEMKQKLKGLEDLDVDAARAALTKVKDWETANPDDKVKAMIAEKEAALKEKFEGDLKTERDKSTGYYGQLEKALIDNAATAALAKHGGNVAVLLPHMRTQAKLVDNGKGGFDVRYTDAKGTELLTRKPNDTSYMGAEEYVEVILMKDDNFAPNFNGNDAEGMGSRGSRKQSGAGGGGDGVATISSTDAKDVTKYRAARKAAAEAGKRLVVTD
jgi:hypothetical protein